MADPETIKNFTREELWILIARLDYFAGISGTNPVWVKIYQEASHALDHLDAAMGRSTVGVPDLPAVLAKKLNTK
jgi:hypothetical protein